MLFFLFCLWVVVVVVVIMWDLNCSWWYFLTDCTRGMTYNKINLVSPGCPRPSIALQVQIRGLKHHSFIILWLIRFQFFSLRVVTVTLLHGVWCCLWMFCVCISVCLFVSDDTNEEPQVAPVTAAPGKSVVYSLAPCCLTMQNSHYSYSKAGNRLSSLHC